MFNSAINAKYSTSYWERGSFTLESVLIFPIVFLFILLLISLSLIQYQACRQFLVTTLAADRVAHNWQVVDKNFVTGEYQITSTRAQLYRFLAFNNLHRELLMQTALYEDYSLANLANMVDQSDLTNSLAAYKDLLSAQSYQSLIHLETRGFNSIHIKTMSPARGMLINNWNIGKEIGVPSFSMITEPGGFIRLIDLLYEL